jgi:hypothetical protein
MKTVDTILRRMIEGVNYVTMYPQYNKNMIIIKKRERERERERERDEV